MVLHPSLLHSERKGIKVLVLGRDEGKIDAFEARTENDADMQRIDVLSVRNLIEAEKLIKRSEPLLVVYEDGFDNKDAVGIQMQLRHVDSKLQFIPVLKTLALPVISQLQKIGNVFDYAESHVMDDYAALKGEILEFVRKHSAKDGVLADLLNVVAPIHHSLLAGFRDWKPIKAISRDCIRVLLPHYDLSTLESASVVAADRIYVPGVSQEEYKKILGNQAPDVLEVIRNAGSWKKPTYAPRSVGGFVVTAGTYLAETHLKKHSLSSVRADVEKKALWLKHPAVRVLSDEVLGQVESALRGKEKKAA